MKFQAKVKKVFDDLEETLDRVPTKAELEAALKEKFQDPATKTGGFLKYWQSRISRLIAELEADGKLANRNSTASSYKQTLAVMTQMLGEELNKMGFEHVNDDFHGAKKGKSIILRNRNPLKSQMPEYFF